MKRRLHSLKLRTTLTLALMTAVILVSSSLVLIVLAWSDERRDIDDNARAYAALATEPVCVGYKTYYESGTHKFFELVRDLTELSLDLEDLRIVDVEGRVLFDSNMLFDNLVQDCVEVVIGDPKRLAAVKGLETVFFSADRVGGERFEIISPFIEDWGAHRFSVVYTFSYRNLRARVSRRLFTSGSLIVIAIGVSLLVGIVLTARIVQPIERLTKGARALAQGRFDAPLEIRSNDEVQDLADAFNHMAGELRRSLRELEASNRRLAAEHQELEAKNAELERFAYSVSHDLKSPLVTIRGFLGVLAEDVAAGDADRIANDIERIDAASAKMARLLSELLELSRIGRVVNEPEEVSMSEAAQEAVEQVAGQIAERGVEIEIAGDMPQVHADRPRLVEVLQNLLDNAIKFTGDQPQPRIEVGCRLLEDRLVFYVRDNGIGIDLRYQDKIFGLFDRLDQSVDGTGVGLALVKRIVEVHGGRIWVESEGPGTGSTFCFTLPPRLPSAV